MSENNGMDAQQMQAMMVQMQQMQAMMAELQAENLKLRSQKALDGVSLKISPTTGIVCLYGVQKTNYGRPVTMYRSAWQKLLTPEITKLVLDFLEANRVELDKVDEKHAEAKEERRLQKEAERQARVASFMAGGTAHKVG